MGFGWKVQKLFWLSCCTLYQKTYFTLFYFILSVFHLPNYSCFRRKAFVALTDPIYMFAKWRRVLFLLRLSSHSELLEKLKILIHSNVTDARWFFLAHFRHILRIRISCSHEYEYVYLEDLFPWNCSLHDRMILLESVKYAFALVGN